MSGHPRFGHTKDGLPVHAHVTDHLPRKGAVSRFNTRFALLTLGAVGSMYCAYIFAAYVLLALPEAIHGGVFGLVQWGASFFLQLVLLSIILVGQNVQGVASDARAAKTFEDVESLTDNLMIALDRLDCRTEGGIKDVADAVAALRTDLATRPKHRGTPP